MSKLYLILSVWFVLVGLLNSEVRAQGDLLVFPKRIVFEGSTKTNELNIANTGKDTARYNISFVQYRMNEDGSFTEIKAPDEGQNFADKNLRYYPRTLILGPNESQVIKVQLTKAETLAPGEYRSHFYFRAIPNAKPLGEEKQAGDTASVAVRLIPIFGITIPAIIRVGPSTTQVSLSDLNFAMRNDTVPQLALKFNRTGNMSVYGELSVSFISESGTKTPVGKASGIAVYTPNSARRFVLNLDRKSGIKYTKGTLHVEYASPSDVKPVKFAEADLVLK
ncbi:MAG: hypothetical protein LWW85_02945 [Marinilabiliales bacterium]|nr:hypothetical protein [Marinilabiliales bacterium]